MGKKLVLFFIVVVILTVTVISNKNEKKTDVENKTETEDDKFVRVAENVSINMLSPDYWIEKQENPKKIIMSKLGISLWNEQYCKQDFWCDERVGENTKYGYTVERAYIRKEPTNEIVSDESGDERFCKLQISSILINEPVVILEESECGQWYYILCRFCEGWIEKKNVGMCENFKQWKAIMNPKDFIIVTGNKEVLDISGKILHMGTKLEIVQYQKEVVLEEKRIPYQCYTAKLPVRNEEGMLEFQYVHIPISSEVSKGYLPYTMENLILQMFKISGSVYGWGGMYDSRDCSQYVMEVYSLFGFEFARNSAAQAKMPFDGYDIKNKTNKEKMKILDKISTGSILYFEGHVMLFLGKVGREYYVISQTARVMENDEIINAHSCMITPLSIKRPNGNTWMNSIETILEIK